jgi:hypothetical protein
MTLPGLGGSENVDRVDSGTGVVHERTMDVGDTVVAFDNIGSIAIIDGARSPLPMIAGAALVVVGLVAMMINNMIGIILMMAGVALTVWGFVRPTDIFLVIGTCDGRRTHIVSKDRKFLSDVKSFLREKIDGSSLATATINISARTISGGIALGQGSTAAGAAGSISR